MQLTERAIGAAGSTFSLKFPAPRPGRRWRVRAVRVELPSWVSGSVVARVRIGTNDPNAPSPTIAESQQGQNDTATGAVPVFTSQVVRVEWTTMPNVTFLGTLQGLATITADEIADNEPLEAGGALTFSNPYEAIPPAPVPAQIQGFVLAVPLIPWNQNVLPMLTGGRRYRIFNIVMNAGKDPGAVCDARLLEASPTGITPIGAELAAVTLTGDLVTPFPFVQPPTGVPLTPNRGILLQTAAAGAATNVYLNLCWSVE